MRSFGKWLDRLLLTVGVLAAGLWVLGPREDATLDFSFDLAVFGSDLDAHFAKQEARFDDITPGVEKRVRSAGQVGEKTPLSLVYIHGFSASSAEMRPIPTMLAERLGANLVYTRLQGHGRDGPAMAEATVPGWTKNAAEAIHAARAIGARVVVFSLSTGGTLAAAAALDPQLMEGVAGLIFVSPNFAVNSPLAAMLTWPAIRYWLPVVSGQERSWEPLIASQARYWTTTYPTVAVLPMAALVKRVSAQDFSAASVPALFWVSPDDRVVRTAATYNIAERWRGPVQIGAPQLTAADDIYAHNIVGDIVSPNQTTPALAVMLDWTKGLE